MTRNCESIQLRYLLKQQKREIVVEPNREYKILGAHWYAKGLYIKDIKFGSEIRATKLNVVEEGDFVYNRLFAWKGSFAIASKDENDCVVSNEFPCFMIDCEKIDPGYLWLYFSREQTWSEALGLSYGATPTSRNRLKEFKLLEMRILLPPLSEQRRIATKLNQLSLRIEEAHRLIESMEKEILGLITG